MLAQSHGHFNWHHHKMKNKNILGICIITLVLSLNLVLAFSPISGYTEQNPLKISPGEEKEMIIHIYPTPEEGTINVKATITEGMDIASISDSSDIYVSSPTSEGLVHVKVSVPSSAAIGSSYTVKTQFVDTAQIPAAGTVSFVIQPTNIFKVVVVEKPVEAPATSTGTSNVTAWIIVIALVVAVLAVVYLIVRRRK